VWRDFPVKKFVSRPLVPIREEFLTAASGNEPPVPRAFRWEDRTLEIIAVVRTWRSTKTDRGDTYLKRHWFELKTADGRKIEVYFDREARRGSARWWLYTIDE
jgi:hypothetical protein